MSALPRLPNALARRVFMHHHALLEPPSGPARGDALRELITRLGFVQIDSVQTVARAHHMILHARRTAYRPAMLRPLLEERRQLFEHWTHDASAIPMAFLPHWRWRFARDAEAIPKRWTKWRREGWQARCDAVLARLAEGPCRADAFDDHGDRAGGGWWDWHPSKTALEYLWRAGHAAICRRQGFRKVYDLAERVYPDLPGTDEPDSIAWACDAALDRLGFATPKQVAAFFELARLDEARAWAEAGLASGRLERVSVEGADGIWREHLARPGLLAEAENLPAAPGRMRVLSPFDPMLRDRQRAERLFGFRYRIEIFVPEAQREYGYYVFPLLEGERLVGRIDMAAEKGGAKGADNGAGGGPGNGSGRLRVAAAWPERGLRWSAARRARLDAALSRTAAMAGLAGVDYVPGWDRPAR